jgi:predicted NAD/FAD-binding protein/2-polyprenyl-3-methyl-5-hydroxy-6-metoxy-1,4-benzoquinol methylase
VLAAFCALQLGLWPKLVTELQLWASKRERAKHKSADMELHWMNMGYWKDAVSYDAACEQLAGLLGDAAGLQQGDRLLCVACGNGDELQYFHTRYNLGHATGLDAHTASPKRSSLEAAGLRLVHGNAEDIARGKQLFCHAEFNRIVVVDSVYHVEKKHFFEDCGTLLPPGGTAAVSDVVVRPSAPSWVKMLLRLMGIRASNQWTQKDYKKHLEAAGLTIIGWESLEPFVLAPWLPTCLHRHLDYVLVSARNDKQRPRPKAAIIGSGLSGLVAGRLLSSTHDVTIFEARKEPGFAGWEAKLPNGAIIDIPLRMIEHNYWKQLIALCDTLGVPLVGTNFTVSLYEDNHSHMIKTSSTSQVFNIFKNFRWYFGLLTTAIHLGLSQARDGESLGEFARRLRQVDSDFYKVGVRRHFSWILSCTYDMVDNYPLNLVQQFFQAILGNFWKSENCTMRVFPSGRRLQDTLLVGKSIRTSCPVAPFTENKEINGDFFDIVVIATEANAVSKILPREWTKFFDEFQYHPSHVIVHRDPSLMPRNRDDWRALNICDDVEGAACQITVWVNAYYSGIDLGGDVFETVNPRHQPHEDLIIRECHLQRVVHTQTSAKLQENIAMSQGREGFYFCGAYAVEGLGLLEQALCSARVAVDAVHRDMQVNSARGVDGVYREMCERRHRCSSESTQ